MKITDKRQFYRKKKIVFFSKEILVESFNYYLDNERYVLIKLLFIGEVSCFCTVRKLRLLFCIIFFLIQVHCIIQVTYLYCSKSIARLLFGFCFPLVLFSHPNRSKVIEKKIDGDEQVLTLPWPITHLTIQSSQFVNIFQGTIQYVCYGFGD